MGLYLCVFEGDEELDGVEVGLYADFNGLRSYVTHEFESGTHGASFPLFILHSDSDGEWSAHDLAGLRREVEEIISAMKSRPPVPFISDWQRKAAQSNGVVPRNAFESFVDVDGEFVLGRIHQLICMAQDRGLPILFQ